MYTIKPPTSNASKLNPSTAEPRPTSAERPAPSRELAQDTFSRGSERRDGLSETSQHMSLTIQNMMSKTSQTQQAASNIAKKHADTANAVIGKISG